MKNSEEKSKLHLENLRKNCSVFPKKLRKLLHTVKPIKELNWYLLCLIKLRRYQCIDKTNLSNLFAIPESERTQANNHDINVLKELIYGRKLVFGRYENILRSFHESHTKP